MMHNKFSKLTLMLLPLIACGGDSKSKVDSGVHLTDSPKAVDAAAACTATADYGTLPAFGSNTEGAQNYPHGTYPGVGSSAPHVEEWFGKINNDAAPDILDISLWAMSGGFGTGDVKTGTYTISGDDANPDKCGICTDILTDLHKNGSGQTVFTDLYHATQGTVTLTSVGTNGSGTLSGSISNLKLTHYDLAQTGSTPSADGCSSTITSGTFSATLQGSAGLFTGTMDNGMPIVIRGRWK